MTANAVAIILEPVFNPELRRVAPATVPFDPQRHPRWPGGRPDGGQFRPRDGAGPVLPTGGKAEAVRRILDGLLRLWRSLRRVPDPPKPAEPPSAPRPSEPAPRPTPQEPAPPREAEPDERPTPGIGHNRPPSEAAPDVEPPPPTASGARQPFKLPIERPTGEGEVARWGQKAADEIREALANNDTHRLTEIEDALAHADWIKPQLDNIIAAQDPPRSLDDLIEAAQEKGRRFGYDNHHIIEQGPQNSVCRAMSSTLHTTSYVFLDTNIGRSTITMAGRKEKVGA